MGITPQQVHKFKVDPAAFRASLIIDMGKPTFSPNSWQDENLKALDPLWKRVAGLKAPGTQKFAWLGRGRGHSKTTDEAIQLIWAIAFSRRQLSGVAAAGSKEQARFIRDAVLRLVMLNSWLKTRIDVQNYRVFNPRTNSEVDIVSSDAPTAFGATPDFILCDELTHWKNDELWTALFSAAPKRPHCALIIMTNAGYEGTWQAKMRDQAISNPDRWVYRNLDGPVASWISKQDLVDQQRGLSPKQYSRLWLNRWQIEVGDALDAQQLRACINPSGRPMAGDEADWEFIAGLDLSTKRHRSALVVLGIHRGERRVRLANCKSWKSGPDGRVSLIDVQAGIREWRLRYRLQLLLFDPYQSELMTQQLAIEGLVCEEMTFKGLNLTLMASTLLQAVQERQIELYDDKDLIDDILKLNIVEKGYGLKLEAPEDEAGHADRALAFAICLPAAVKLAGVLPVRPFVDRPVAQTMDELHLRLQKIERGETPERSPLIGTPCPRCSVTLIASGTGAYCPACHFEPLPELAAQKETPPREAFLCPQCGLTSSEPVCVKCREPAGRRDVLSLALEEAGISLEGE